MARPPGSKPPADADLVLLGAFGRPHGLRGEVRLKSHTGDPLAIARYGPLVASDGRRIELVDVRPAPGGAPDLLIARVKDISDRSGAEALNRITLFVPRGRLAETEDADEFLATDLVGLTAVTGNGAAIGIVVAVPNYGGGDLLEIAPVGGGATALLPFTRAFVPILDIPNGRLVVDPPDDLFNPPQRKPAGKDG